MGTDCAVSGRVPYNPINGFAASMDVPQSLCSVATLASEGQSDAAWTHRGNGPALRGVTLCDGGFATHLNQTPLPRGLTRLGRKRLYLSDNMPGGGGESSSRTRQARPPVPYAAGDGYLFSVVAPGLDPVSWTPLRLWDRVHNAETAHPLSRRLTAADHGACSGRSPA